MEALGFFVCDADLEDELIRALGVATVERLIESAGRAAVVSAPCRNSRHSGSGRANSSSLGSWDRAAGRKALTTRR